ncbi:MAG: ribosome recycling factor [Verrucomicrobia bacterium]|nr:ribosome recycling factor [Verrucomicrobiota bacterium]
MDIKKVIADGATAMKKAVDHTSHEFATLHTGKASPGMIENLQVHVEAYGMTQRLKDMAAITTPDAQNIVVQPFDKAAMEDIRKAIQAANIGINPVPQGNFLRCPVPSLSGERRLELAKKATQMAEEGKVRVRNARRDALELLKKGNKEKVVTDDELKRSEKDVQTNTDKFIAEIEKNLKAKEAELKG